MTDEAIFRVIDTTYPKRLGRPHVDITDLPNLEAAQRYIRQLAEDDYPTDGLVIESRSDWAAVSNTPDELCEHRLLVGTCPFCGSAAIPSEPEQEKSNG